MANNDSMMPPASHWMNVDLFTVDQAAALWINVDPASISSVARIDPPEHTAVKQMLTGGIMSGELHADTSTNALRIIGNHSESLISRADLEAFARKRNLFPAFLFDTLAPFQQSDLFASRTRASRLNVTLPQEPAPVNRGGRPAQYDWDSFAMEIIRQANLPDGLPEKQADLVRGMLAWFQATYDQEPAESAVKARISKIYRYLGEARNQSA
jgi:hypothetical protein